MRAILSLAITASQGQVPAVKAQVKTSYQAGWTKEEIGKVLLQVYCFAGVYKPMTGFEAARHAFKEPEARRDLAITTPAVWAEPRSTRRCPPVVPAPTASTLSRPAVAATAVPLTRWPG